MNPVVLLTVNFAASLSSNPGVQLLHHYSIPDDNLVFSFGCRFVFFRFVFFMFLLMTKLQFPFAGKNSFGEFKIKLLVVIWHNFTIIWNFWQWQRKSQFCYWRGKLGDSSWGRKYEMVEISKDENWNVACMRWVFLMAW